MIMQIGHSSKTAVERSECRQLSAARQNGATERCPSSVARCEVTSRLPVVCCCYLDASLCCLSNMCHAKNEPTHASDSEYAFGASHVLYNYQICTWTTFTR